MKIEKITGSTVYIKGIETEQIDIDRIVFVRVREDLSKEFLDNLRDMLNRLLITSKSDKIIYIIPRGIEICRIVKGDKNGT